MIKFEDISVVIQGPVYHSNNMYEGVTKKVCESVRKNLPGAEIILSTWEGFDLSGLDYDQIVINKNIISNKIRMPYTGDLKLFSVNHQLITTLNGIKKSTRKYILKLRSDLSLTGSKFLNYFDYYSDYPEDVDLSKWKIFNKRIITLPTYNIHKEKGLAFNICDWFFFGLKEDVEYYFDIPLIDTFNLLVREGEEYPRVEDNFGAEQIMWISCVRKKMDLQIKNAIDKSDEVCNSFEKSIANNFVLISAKQASVLSLSYGVGAYGVAPCFSRGLYSLEEWEHLYNKYGGGRLSVNYRWINHLFTFLYATKESICENSPMISKAYYACSKKLNKKRLK